MTTRAFLSHQQLRLRTYFMRFLAPHRGVNRRDGTRGDPLLKEWVRALPCFQRVVVVAGGPSANLLIGSHQQLHVTTNAAYKLMGDWPYVYFVSDGANLWGYLKWGVPGPGLLATVIREETVSGAPVVTQMARAVARYKRRYVRAYPEIFATDLWAEGPWRDNYEELEVFIQDHLGMKFKQFNSGFGAVQIGYYLAVKLSIPLHIYGMDAGEGGPQHFDGSPSVANAVSGGRVRAKLRELLGALESQPYVEVVNHSYFT